MKKGYVITIVCLLLALCVLGGLIYFDLFQKDKTDEQPIDMTLFAQAMQDIENSKALGTHLRILIDPDGKPELFRYDKALAFTVEILKQNKAALLHTSLETEYITHTGYYELYYDNGWKPELTDGKPVMIVEKTTHHYENMDLVEAVFAPAGPDTHPTTAQLDAAKGIIEKRLVANNITDYEASIDETSGEISLRFPWTDTSNAGIQDILSKLTMKGMLQFYEGKGTFTSDGEEIPPIDGKLILDGSDVKTAEAAMNADANTASNSPYVVSLKLTDAGKTKFANATQKLLGSTISIWLDRGENWAEEYGQPRYAMLSAPTVESPITDGVAVITGFVKYEDAKEIADLINSDSLPFEMYTLLVSVTKAKDR